MNEREFFRFEFENAAGVRVKWTPREWAWVDKLLEIYDRPLCVKALRFIGFSWELFEEKGCLTVKWLWDHREDIFSELQVRMRGGCSAHRSHLQGLKVVDPVAGISQERDTMRRAQHAQGEWIRDDGPVVGWGDILKSDPEMYGNDVVGCSMDGVERGPRKPRKGINGTGKEKVETDEWVDDDGPVGW